MTFSILNIQRLEQKNVFHDFHIIYSSGPGKRQAELQRGYITSIGVLYFSNCFFFLGPAAKEPSNCISKSSELKRQFRDLALWPILEGKYGVYFYKKKPLP